MAKEFVVKLSVDSTGAVQGLDNLEKEIVSSSNATQSLKGQLRDIQRQLETLDPNTKEWEKLKNQASEIKDKLKDTAEAINNDAGPAFESLANNAGTLTSQLMSMDLEGATASMQRMSSNVKKIDFKTLSKELGGFVKSVGQMGKALLMNPIFLIGAAIAMIIVHFDKLKTLVDGVSGEMSKNLEIAKDGLEVEKAKGDMLASSENILRLQGKSEREILNMKIEQLKAQIAQAEVVNSQMDGIAVAQIEAAERNKEITKGILNFLTIGFRVIAMEIDAIGDGLVKIGILEKGFGLTNKLDQGVDALANMVFNPEEVRKQAAESKKASDLELQNMKNSLAGHQLAIKNIDKKAADDRAAKAKEESDKALKAKEEALKKEIELERWANDEIARMDAEIDAQKIKDIQDAHARDKAEIEATRAQDAELNRMVAEMEAEQEATAAQALEDKKKRKEQEIQLATSGLQALMDLNDAFAGKSKKAQERAFKINKALQIAQALIQTYQSATAAYASQVIPGDPTSPVRGAIAAGIAIASGLAQVAKIKATKFDGGGGGGSGGGSGAAASIGSGGVGSSAPAFNPIDFRSLTNRPPQTAQTYVLAGQVSNAQDANEKVKRLARLG